MYGCWSRSVFVLLVDFVLTLNKRDEIAAMRDEQRRKGAESRRGAKAQRHKS